MKIENAIRLTEFTTAILALIVSITSIYIAFQQKKLIDAQNLLIENQQTEITSNKDSIVILQTRINNMVLYLENSSSIFQSSNSGIQAGRDVHLSK